VTRTGNIWNTGKLINVSGVTKNKLVGRKHLKVCGKKTKLTRRIVNLPRHEDSRRKNASSGRSSRLPSGAALPMYSKCLPPHLVYNAMQQKLNEA
jgi:hypothetical protein